ncbi:MAG: M48 family metallopeptidase [Endomicrobium sp.]|jgi:heat shock protein HtpX|nr:M48 family metallopeptidase [Endomicrobium sp.]
MKNTTVYDFIDSNSRKTIYLMILFFVSFVVVSYFIIILAGIIIGGEIYNCYDCDTNRSIFRMISGITTTSMLPIISVVAIIWIMVAYFAGKYFILSASGASELTASNAPEIIHIVENIAIMSGLPIPKVYTINDNALNAFATGRDPKHSYIVLTKGIIEKLEKTEIEGVIAHEMAHIKNRDTKLMLIAIVCIGFATTMSELLLRYALTPRTRIKTNKNNTAQSFLFVFVIFFYIYGYLLAPLIKLAVSRTREFQADATAAFITRNPQGLINALKKISNNSVVHRLNDKKIIAMICIANPLIQNKKRSIFLKISGLFATHPSIVDRIKALESIGGYR